MNSTVLTPVICYTLLLRRGSLVILLLSPSAARSLHSSILFRLPRPATVLGVYANENVHTCAIRTLFLCIHIYLINGRLSQKRS